MKKFAQILIITLLLAGAGRAWAIDVYNPDGTPATISISVDGEDILSSNVGPKDLWKLSDGQLAASATRAGGKDLTVINAEIDTRKLTSNQWNDARNFYNQAYYGAEPSAGSPGVWIDNNGTIQTVTIGANGANPKLTMFDPTSRKWTTDASNHFAFLNTTRGNGGVPPPPLEDKTFPNCGLDPFCGMIKAVAWLLQKGAVTVFSWFSMLANQIFNIAVNQSVRNFDKIGNSEGVRVAWRAMRDLVNISLIFVLLYVAIGTILQLSSVNGKHLLKNVIIAALLVNFSAFFTGIIIDTSNVLANSLYELAGQGHARGVNNAPDIISPLTQAAEQGYKAKLATAADEAVWANSSSVTGTADKYTILLQIIVAAFGTIALMLITTTVLFAGAILFFVRSIVLTFVIVASPIAFLAFAIGGSTMGKLSSKWKDGLTNQIIFAPAFMLLIFLTVKIVTADTTRGLIGDTTFAGGIAVFMLINGLMLGALIVAKELGVAGAAGATKFGGSLTGFGAKLIGRPIAGVALKLPYDRARAWLNKKPEGDGPAGNWVRAKQSFSNIITKGKTMPGVKEAIQVVGQERGILRSAKEAVLKPGQFLNESIAAGTGINVLGKTVDEQRKQKDEEKKDKEAKDSIKLDDLKDDLNNMASEGNVPTPPPKPANSENLTPEERAAQKAYQDKVDKVQKVSNKDIVKIDVETLKKLAHLLSDSQMKALGDGKDGIDPDKFKKVQEARIKPLKDALRNTTEPEHRKEELVSREVGKMSVKALKDFVESLDEITNKDDFESVIKAIDRVNPEAFKAINKSESMTMARGARINALRGMRTSPPVNMEPARPNANPTNPPRQDYSPE